MRRGKDVSSFLSEFDSVTHVPRPNNAKNTNRLNNKNHTLPTHPAQLPPGQPTFLTSLQKTSINFYPIYDRGIDRSGRFFPLIVRSKIRRCKNLSSLYPRTHLRKGNPRIFALFFFFSFFVQAPRVSRSLNISFKNLFTLQTFLNFLFPPSPFLRSYFYIFEDNKSRDKQSKAMMEIFESSGRAREREKMSGAEV